MYICVYIYIYTYVLIFILWTCIYFAQDILLLFSFAQS